MNRTFRRSLLSTLAWQMNPRRGADRRLVTGVRTMNQGTLRGKSLFRPTSIVCLLAGLSAFATVALADGKGSKAAAKVGDAYARGSDGGFVWTIGTKSIQMTFDGRGGVFRLVSFLNKSCDPPLEYVDAKTAAAPFALDSESFGKKRTGAKPAAEADSQWTLKTGAARQVASGGRPAVQLDVTLTRGDILAQFHVLAFPGTSILRQWVEIENAGSQPVVLKSPASACLQLRGDEATSYVNSWMIGGYAAADQGKMDQTPITSPYNHKLDWHWNRRTSCRGWPCIEATGPKTACSSPWNTWARGRWQSTMRPAGPLTATAGIPELKIVRSPTGPAAGIAAGHARRLPRRAGQHGGVALRLAIRIPVGLHQRRLLCPLPMRDLVVLLLAESPGAVHGPLGQSRHEHQRRDADHGIRDALG